MRNTSRASMLGYQIGLFRRVATSCFNVSNHPILKTAFSGKWLASVGCGRALCNLNSDTREPSIKQQITADCPK